MQRWKQDPSLFDCNRDQNGHKSLDYHSVYVEEFLNSDPIRDWESIDRCKQLWFWSLEKLGNEYPVVPVDEWKVLDCGTKDGQFPEFLEPIVDEVTGIEISPNYVQFAKSKGRPVVFGDVCNLSEDYREHFDYVFSHHLLGLTPDYYGALEQMYEATKPGGYMITCNDLPGNPKKHYSYIKNEKIFSEFSLQTKANVIYNDRWSENFPKEWVFFVKKPKE